jgi:hypothetical protein
MDAKVINCKNCEVLFQGKYCPNCKQSAQTSRITWHELGDHLLHAFFHVDRGLLHTVIEMFLRPGKAIAEYLEGKRAYHFNPFLFLILLGGTASLLYAAFHVNVIAERIDIESIEKFNPIFAHKHFTIVASIVLFFLTLTDLILYRERKYTTPELLISNAFQVGEILLLLIVVLPLLYFQNYFNAEFKIHIELRYVILIGMYLYLFLVRYHLYQAKRNYMLILKIIVQLIFLCIIIQYRAAKMLVENIQ